MLKYFIPLILLISFFSFSVQVNTELPNAIDLKNFDLSVNPASDFYNYVNGNWLKNNPIPSGSSSWSAFSAVRKTNHSGRN